MCLQLIHTYLLFGLYNSSFHNVVIHYTNLYCCHTTELKSIPGNALNQFDPWHLAGEKKSYISGKKIKEDIIVLEVTAHSGIFIHNPIIALDIN